MRYALASVAALSATACMSAQPDFNAIELACKGVVAYEQCIQFHVAEHQAQYAQHQRQMFLMGQALQGMAATPQAAPPPAPAPQFQPLQQPGYLVSQDVDGFVRTCVYRVGLNTMYQSLPHTQLCPLTY